jgi:hypothetical protein
MDSDGSGQGQDEMDNFEFDKVPYGEEEDITILPAAVKRGRKSLPGALKREDNF